MSAELLEKLRRASLTVATAESCTGGLVAAALTEPAGASDVFLCGFVTYANEAKIALLGVPEAVIAAHGAVSEAVARAMAEGARARAGADIAVSITGIAGPTGGSAEKPVGLVWFGLAKQGITMAERRVFEGGRADIRRAAAAHALRLLEP